MDKGHADVPAGHEAPAAINATPVMGNIVHVVAMEVSEVATSRNCKYEYADAAILPNEINKATT